MHFGRMSRKERRLPVGEAQPSRYSSPMSGTLKTRLKHGLYRAAVWAFPRSFRRVLGGSSTTRRWRDRFFRPGGRPELIGDELSWQNFGFQFAAPYQVLHRAQTRGVENRICRLAQSVLQAGDSAVDVGANYGFVSLVLGRCVEPGGRVISFEIDPQIRAALAGSAAASGLQDVIRLTSQGAGATDSEDLRTVDTAVRELGLDDRIRFLKIDVDGLDFEVLQGAADTLRSSQPVVVIEMTRSAEEIYDALVSAGYKHFMDQENQPVTRGDQVENLIASVEPVSIPAPAS